MSQHARHLEDTRGAPFFYLGDTAWELFHRLDRDEADRYLAKRAARGFTVIQAVALAPLGLAALLSPRVARTDGTPCRQVGATCSAWTRRAMIASPHATVSGSTRLSADTATALQLRRS